jgi:hypothetical protein
VLEAETLRAGAPLRRELPDKHDAQERLCAVLRCSALHARGADAADVCTAFRMLRSPRGAVRPVPALLTSAGPSSQSPGSCAARLPAPPPCPTHSLQTPSFMHTTCTP